MGETLFGLNREEIGQRLVNIGVPSAQLKMRTEQVWHAMYVTGADRFSEITSISKQVRQSLDENFSLERAKITTELISRDGTIKWLIQFPSPAPKPPVQVETVFIPDGDRGTLCLSSQVGCTLTCSFCHTGTQRLVRNLTAGEIISQIVIARDRVKCWDRGSVGTPQAPQITNIVMMGMGEPLYNFDSVRDALKIAIDPSGLGFSKRRVTVSTSGVVPAMRRLGEELDVMLAVSLHAVTNEVRDALMPINKRYPIEQLLQACRDFQGLSNARRITFEYVMLDSINDSIADAKKLVQLIRGIPAKINLIPFNPWPGCDYGRSTDKNIRAFAETVSRAGYASPVRTPRGTDIMAACGQLKSASKVLLKRRKPAQEEPALLPSETIGS